MINDIIHFDTGLDEIFNNFIIKKLITHRSWSISDDESAFGSSVLSDYSDTGMLLQSFRINQPDFYNNTSSDLNVLADLITNISIKKQNKYNFTNVRYLRFLWNYYNRSSTGVKHADSVQPNTASIIYYLNTCDAFTVIGDLKFNCIAGTGILFNSNLTHFGTGPSASKNKFALNIVFEYDMVC
jgi:hypothetical protein